MSGIIVGFAMYGTTQADDTSLIVSYFDAALPVATQLFPNPWLAYVAIPSAGAGPRARVLVSPLLSKLTRVRARVPLAVAALPASVRQDAADERLLPQLGLDVRHHHRPWLPHLAERQPHLFL